MQPPKLPLDSQLCFSLYGASMAVNRTYKPMNGVRGRGFVLGLERKLPAGIPFACTGEPIPCRFCAASIRQWFS